MTDLAPLPELLLTERTVAVADLHLDPYDERSCASFGAWARALEARRLMVLGDLFDTWVGPAHEGAPGAQKVIEAFRGLTAVGREVLLLQGNRDFLLGASFERASGARVFADGLVGVSEGGERALFLHGDELCTRDRAYQRLRRVTHSRVVQRLGPRVPLFLSRRVARRLRRVSQQAVAAKPSEQKAIQAGAAEAYVRAHGCRSLVCGHVHEARDVELPGGARWLILDAFGGQRDAAWIEAGQIGLGASGGS
jgi:UDP-2,3-diacylglucosamine hydrolase